MIRPLALLSCLALAAPFPAAAQPAPGAAAAGVHAALDQTVQAGTVPGALLLLVRDGRTVVFEAQGVTDAQSKTPLKTDSVFWLASMSKPITAVAVLMLVEEGKVRLDDPVSRFIPEYKTQRAKVLRPGSPPPPPPGPPGAAPAGPPPQYDLVPAVREITVRDLLTHTSGILAGFADPAVPALADGDTLATWVPKLAAAPLEHQPGAAWVYSNAAGFDVLSRIVEAASGQPYNRFVQARILEPLGMTETGFGPRPGLEARMTPLPPQFPTDPRLQARSYFSGAAGMFGTAGDYAKFARMLVDGGRAANGRRLLKAETVAMMGSNQVGGLFTGLGGRPGSAAGMGFGLGVAVVRDGPAGGLAVPNGSFGWDGAGGGRFWISPAEHQVLIMFAPNQGAQSSLERAVAQAPIR